MQPSASPVQAPGIRGRANSLLHRGLELGTSVLSPLAQVYPPVAVDDADGAALSTSPTHLNTTPIAHAPMIRRRYSSMHRFPGMDPHSSPTSVTLKRFATTSTTRGGVLDASVPEGSPLSEHDETEDQEIHTRVKEPSEPDPIVESHEDERHSTLLPGVNQKLRDIEARQKRMEDMIVQLMTELRNARSDLRD